MCFFVIIAPVVSFEPIKAQEGGNSNVSLTSTAIGSTPHQIDLQVTQIPSGQLNEVSGFIIKPESIVQIVQGENIIVSTSPNLQVHQVKVTNTQGQLVDLLLLPDNAWSLQELTPGGYMLDVLVEMSSSGRMGAYETVLVIIQPNQQPLPPAQYINQITATIKTHVRTIYPNDTSTLTPGLKPSPCYFDPALPECQPIMVNVTQDLVLMTMINAFQSENVQMDMEDWMMTKQANATRIAL